MPAVEWSRIMKCTTPGKYIAWLRIKPSNIVTTVWKLPLKISHWHALYFFITWRICFSQANASFLSEFHYILITGEKGKEKRHGHACLNMSQQLKLQTTQFHLYNVNSWRSNLIKKNSKLQIWKKFMTRKKENFTWTELFFK